MKGDKIVHEVDVHSASLVLLEFLYLRPVSLLRGSHRVHWASTFQKDTAFIRVVKRNFIGSPAVEGGDFLGSQDDVQSSVKFGDILSQTSNPRTQT